MPLLKNGRVIEDQWITVEDDAALPAGGSVIVSLDRWLEHRAALKARNAPLGIRLRSDQHADAIAEDVERFDVIVLEFPAFTDGRSYSTARILREQHDYRGELRAAGQILRDQFLFLHRCGFDSFEVADASAVEAWQEAVSEFSVAYQPAAAGGLSVLALRHRPLAAE